MNKSRVVKFSPVCKTRFTGLEISIISPPSLFVIFKTELKTNPAASLPFQPVICSAAGLIAKIFPFESTAKTPSSTASKIAFPSPKKLLGVFFLFSEFSLKIFFKLNIAHFLDVNSLT